MKISIKVLSVFMALTLIACSHNTTNNNDSPQLIRNGTTPEQAIVFPNVKGSITGVPMEYKWIKENHPGFRPVKQLLIEKQGQMYDVIYIENENGEKKAVYFDITNWYGRL